MSPRNGDRDGATHLEGGGCRRELGRRVGPGEQCGGELGLHDLTATAVCPTTAAPAMAALAIAAEAATAAAASEELGGPDTMGAPAPGKPGDDKQPSEPLLWRIFSMLIVEVEASCLVEDTGSGDVGTGEPRAAPQGAATVVCGEDTYNVQGQGGDRTERGGE